MQSSRTESRSYKQLFDKKIENLITLKELAARLQITESGAYKLVHQGKIPYWKVGRLLRFDWGDVLAAIRKG